MSAGPAKASSTLPGPRARSLLERERTWVSQNYVKDYPLVVDRAEGATIIDVDGNRYLDFAAGRAVPRWWRFSARFTAAPWGRSR